MRHGFEIKINDGPPIRAGLGIDKYVVTCILNAVRRGIDPTEELSISISGLNSIEQEQVDWLKADLQLGDTIQITVIDGHFDPPCNTRPGMTEADIVSQKLRYYYALKEELREHLQE